MDLYVTNIHRSERQHRLHGESNDWTVHFTSTLDDGAELEVWGDISTDKPEVAEQFKLGQRWTLSPEV